MVKPFVSEQNHWMVDKHAIFQGYYFFHHLGLDRDMREQFRDHEWFDHTAEFCADFDQPAFDPGVRHAAARALRAAGPADDGGPQAQHLHAVLTPGRNRGWRPPACR